MAENKTILQTLQNFTKKLNDFSERGGTIISQSDSEAQNLKKLQNQINQQEEEKMAALRTQFQEFAEPITQDIEKDEEDLQKAYELFCQLKLLNEQAGDRQTHLKSLSLTSPLCHKSEYTAEGSGSQNNNHFAFLRLWFLSTKPDAQFVPEISADAAGGFVLDFTEIELWQPTTFEKEIIQAFDN